MKRLKVIFLGIYIWVGILLMQPYLKANSTSPENFSTFREWCLNQTNISPTSQYTVKILLQKARTNDCIEADKKLSSLSALSLNNNYIINIAPISSLKNL
ncbi:MAG: leucine-rich repeat domain-containing protein, partial [Okeania sp. SIO4D6]|nr:leucine-rich repeat domain-containing protein [Okeania sp. SIO4D6]